MEMKEVRRLERESVKEGIFSVLFSSLFFGGREDGGVLVVVWRMSGGVI